MELEHSLSLGLGIAQPAYSFHLYKSVRDYGSMYSFVLEAETIWVEVGHSLGLGINVWKAESEINISYKWQ